MTTDPRQPSARAFHIAADGTVDGLELRVLPISGARYKAKSVAVIGEKDAGQTMNAKVFVVGPDGLPVVGAKVWLLWPWNGGEQYVFKSHAAPGNNNYPIDHVIYSVFDPNAQPPRSHLGPLAIAVVDSDGNIVSDIVAGLGLPGEIDELGNPKGARHVGFQILFAGVTGEDDEPTTDPDPEPDDGGTDTDPDPEMPSNDAALTQAVVRIADAMTVRNDLLRRLVEHFGA